MEYNLITDYGNLVEGALRNVNLIIEPPAVRRGQHAILRCMYDLEGAPLYSAKFYRGQLEFYRYTPGEFPNTKVFPFPGIHVDVTSSNATQVLIRNVGFGLSGNFSCEVTADAPLFSTATAFATMQVVELPDKRPLLFTEQTRYEPGDVLRANCSTPPSRPRAELKFTINNMVVNNADVQYIRTIDNLIASRISLKLQLQGVHFSSVNPSNYGHVYGINSVHGGGLVLRCTATIGELYQEYKEIELGTPQKDPVPARVTLSSGSTVKNFMSLFSSGGNTKTTTFDSTKLFLLTAICHFASIDTLLLQLYSSVHKLLRYKFTQHSQQNGEGSHLQQLLSQR
uniref:Ig-like domain-containing protein n=1 Tax=Stomoxys calcitrans TaxID=35570 RepID=A0A1I8NWK0_STOCA